MKLSNGEISTVQHVPTAQTRQTVKDLSSFKVSVKQIALYLRLAEATVRKHYEYELNAGAVELIADAGKTIHNATKRGDTDSAKFILSRIGNCAPPPKVIITENLADRIAETAADTLKEKESESDY